MAQSLEQIMADLGRTGGYDADRGILNDQLAKLPGQQEAEIKGLDAKLSNAYDDIVTGARGRGLGFSGIPLAEQARYNATEYAPAVARVKAAGEQSRIGILQSLNSLSRDQRTQAQGIYDTTRAFDEQVRQFNEQMAESQRARAAASAAAASAGAGAYLGGGGGGASQQQQGGGKPVAAYSKEQGFQYRDASGQPITAARYAALTGANLTELLQQMANKGDRTAQRALLDKDIFSVSYAMKGGRALTNAGLAAQRYGNIFG